jgi:uncharacterized protein (DUF362 family)
VLLKPNGVIAHPKLFPDAFTRAEFLDGVLGAVRDTGRDLKEVAVGERCGITMPTRMSFAGAGWDAVVRRHRARAYYFEEEPQVEVRLTREPRLRDTLYTPEPVARADYLLNLPKFKAHPWTTVTFALKNYIGIQDDAHRLIDHDYALDEKIADLQEIAPQRFIAVDAIAAGQDRMLTPTPFALGLVVMGNNSVAVDAVCCQIIGLDPARIRHIAAASAKGFGPLDLARIDLGGDVALDRARDLAKGFRAGLVRVEKYFEGTRITALAGPPPEDESRDYCWGGCPGAVEEAIEIVRRLDARADEKMRPLTLVFGGYRGPISVRPGGKVVFIGDCARWQGEIDGEPVKIESIYLNRRERDPHRARAEGIFAKMARIFWCLFLRRREKVLRFAGCPVTVAEHTLLLASLGGTRNPYFVPTAAAPFLRAWVASGIVRGAKRLLGVPVRRPTARRAPAG